MTEVSDTTYDAYLEGLAAAKEEELGQKLVQAEEDLEEVRNQITDIIDTCGTYYDSEVGQHRIKGYANEDALHDLEAQEEELEKLVDQLDTQLAAL
ncbi:hypothetical protein [Limnobacter sp.]|uniref:hypothetical protein n=1 Tax=Limnobacter sp. TaxID=2003368 RepID=UPI0025C5248E|nr:hypothetical protein [Limnobacter sp.]